MPSLSHRGTPDDSNDLDAIAESRQSIPPESRRSGPSDYALQREANIAENNKLLASLGLLDVSSLLGSDKSSKKGKKKKGGEEKRYVFCLFCAAHPMI